ncbi:MAG TPA: hypothetical protein VHH09_00605 [Acidimicrobiales bacterium]|nr:hypothetical protein [Acidimicrobiales bacterium]
MGRASSSKKVARVARTGGGRTRRGQSTSWFWPVFIGFVVVLGTTGIVYSKEQREPDNTRPRAGAPGRAGDHWHAALGFNICGTWAPNLTDQGEDRTGLHTHADGVIHIHPFSEVYAGKRATFDVFAELVGVKVTRTEISLPNQDPKKNGDKCGDRDGLVQIMRWPSKSPEAEGTIYAGDPGELRMRDRELITVAFLPRGDEIPRPPSADELDRLSDVSPITTAPSQAPSTVPGETTVPGDTTPSTGPPEATTVPSATTPPESPSAPPTAGP